MKVLLTILVLCSAAQADDGFRWIVPAVKEAPTPPPPAPTIEVAPPVKEEPKAEQVDVRQFVYPIRVFRANTNPEVQIGSTTNNGSAVSVGGGRLVTAAHLLNGIPNPWAQVKIDGQWVFCSVTVVPGVDVADVFVSSRKDLKGTTRAEPKYGQGVLVYGLASDYVLTGYVSNRGPADISVSLDPDQNRYGTLSGDSGGGVFSVDGVLLATITGKNPLEKLVVTAVPTSLATRQGLAASPQAQPQPPQAAPRANTQPQAPPGYRWQCNGNGCTLVPVSPLPMQGQQQPILQPSVQVYPSTRQSQQHGGSGLRKPGGFLGLFGRG